ncbi:MAG: endonuclease domain-containing protein [Actinomycetota bacterium]|nr:endonuclease domain-containing protein [Actinomycetota bacterium]
MHAASMWAGSGSALSHSTAAAKLGLESFRSEGPIHVLTDRPLKSDKIIVHRSSVRRGDTTSFDGLRITTATRTLFDLASYEAPERVEAALDDALTRGLTSIPYLTRRLALLGRRGRPGTALIRRLLDDRLPDETPRESELERAFDRFVIKPHALERPAFQFEVFAQREFVARVDFAYPDALLGIEVLGWKGHSGRAAWQRDLERNNRLTRLGWQVLYFTWLDVTQRASSVADEIEATLELRRGAQADPRR